MRRQLKFQDLVTLPFKVAIALTLNLICLLLPYRLRTYYIRFVAFLFHAPFYIFGKLATYLFKKLEIDPSDLKE